MPEKILPMTASSIFLFSCLSFSGGVFLSSFFYFSQFFLLGALILATFLIAVLFQHRRLVVFGFCLILLVLGVTRQQSVANARARPELASLIDQRVVLEGIVAEEPSGEGARVRVKVKVREVGGKLWDKGWKILVTTRAYPTIQYGDELRIVGKLEQPSSFGDFDYQSYLKRRGIYFLISYPEIEILEKGRGNFLQAALLDFKNNLKDSLGNFLPAPQFGLMEALMFGEENNLSSAWKEKMNVSGTRHIVAVSGMNITIISKIVFAAFLGLGLWRRQAFYLTSVIIFLFILMIGAPSSGVRAGIMGILLLAAQNFGYLANPRRLMIFALTSMLLADPTLAQEIGFQLSFLAVWGLVELQKPLARIFRRAPNWLGMRENLSTTLAAQIFTLPLLAYNFGQISLVAPLTNILILPLLPYLTILGFVFSFLGMMMGALGQALAWPAWLMLSYVIKVIDFFSQMFSAAFSLKLPEILVWAFYVVVIVLLWVWETRKVPEFLRE